MLGMDPGTRYPSSARTRPIFNNSSSPVLELFNSQAQNAHRAFEWVLKLDRLDHLILDTRHFAAGFMTNGRSTWVGKWSLESEIPI